MYPEAYIDFLIYFHVERDYFECHEVLEEHWKKKPRGQRERHWVALLQVAIALYHHRRENEKGARIMYRKAANLIGEEREALEKLSLNTEEILQSIEEQVQILNEKKPFKNIDLTITDESLLKACQVRCIELVEREWVINNNHIEDYILHKHTLRDLNAVIAERERQLALRVARRKERDAK